VRYEEVRARVVQEPACPDRFEIGGVSIEPIRLSHPNQGNGYKFVEDGRSFVFLTDNELGFPHKGGLSFEAYREVSAGADLLIHDGEFTEEEYRTCIQWGHSTSAAALDLAMAAGVKRLGLFHLNQDRTDQDVDRMVDRCSQVAAEAGSALECFAVGADMSFEV
jgi:ribonuclease BN (tRNA processing enzyme)